MKKALLTRLNSESFEQLLIEAKNLKKTIKDIYYSGHTGTWTVQNIDGSSEDLLTIFEVMDEVVHNYSEQFKKSDTLVL